MLVEDGTGPGSRLSFASSQTDPVFSPGQMDVQRWLDPGQILDLEGFECLFSLRYMCARIDTTYLQSRYLRPHFGRHQRVQRQEARRRQGNSGFDLPPLFFFSADRPIRRSQQHPRDRGQKRDPVPHLRRHLRPPHALSRPSTCSPIRSLPPAANISSHALRLPPQRPEAQRLFLRKREIVGRPEEAAEEGIRPTAAFAASRKRQGRFSLPKPCQKVANPTFSSSQIMEHISSLGDDLPQNGINIHALGGKADAIKKEVQSLVADGHLYNSIDDDQSVLGLLAF